MSFKDRVATYFMDIAYPDGGDIVGFGRSKYVKMGKM